MKRAQKGLAINLLLTVAISMSIVTRIHGYCFVNNSDIESIKVIVFKNDKDLKNYLTTTGWTEKAATTMVAIGKIAGRKILQYSTGIDIEPIINWFGDAYKYQMPLYWLGELAKKIELYKYSLKSHTIPTGEKACWAWSEIEKKIKNPTQKTLTFFVVDPKNTENPIVFVGDLNFGCGLVLEREGKVTIYYPFLDEKQQIHLLTMPEGEARGYALPENILPVPEEPSPAA